MIHERVLVGTLLGEARREIWVGEGTHREHRRYRGRFRHRIHDR